MINVLIEPYNDSSTRFLRNFLKQKNVRLIKPNLRPNVLHIVSRNPRFIVSKVKKIKPDLVISHSIHYPRIAYNVPYLFLPIKKTSDLLIKVPGYTNNLALTRLYLKKVGITAELNFFTSESKYDRRGVFKSFIRGINLNARLNNFKNKLLIE